MHAWIKIKTTLLFGIAMALVCIGLVACQEPPPRQKIETKPIVVSMKIPPSPSDVGSESEVVDPIPLPGNEPHHAPVLPLGASTAEKLSLSSLELSTGSLPESTSEKEASPAQLRDKNPPETPAVARSLSESGAEPAHLEPEAELPLSNSFALEPYSSMDKINPFTPLIQTQPKETIAVYKGEKKPTRTLTPLEKFDLSQIRLVAVLTAESGKIAMVEEASGKGYVVKIGTYIGKDSGTVVQILTDRIVINEIITDFKGEEVSRTREMKLHKQEIEG